MSTEKKTNHAYGSSQKFLGDKGILGLIVLLSAFVPLSTDLYLPALPGMADYFNAPVSIVNLTLILFFIFFSMGMLFWGPLSDKYGRKPVLLTGLVIYIAASCACALSWDIWHLVLFRVLQAVGGSAASAVATAMVKDVYEGRKRESALAVVQSMVVLSPALAPVIGAFMLPYTSWPGLFWTLAAIGGISLFGSLLLEETNKKRYTGSIAGSFGRLAVVLKNPGFTSLLLVFSLVSTASLAFIADSSYIFVDDFGLSEKMYSFYFAINALFLIAGPFLYIRLSKTYSRLSIITLSFIVMIASGALVSIIGNFSPLLFTLALIPSSLMGSCVRPSGTYLMLEQQKEDTGSASSLINCSGLIFGSLGMTLVSISGENLVLSIGIINMAVGLVCLTGWTIIGRMNIVKKSPDFS
ncbi:DHA1 family bicyclomycin/chloramphenicol resistance-like MFS transporter [Methanomicrobium sp. W14]|uniref:multidrug effflux MFS transporter n=1 Tax=Methanomicrobium sp. W14 TaxID=2817839 RepID=UPI001AE8897B|nr:multidrug effflux MFS transporter [Methanomicrobium sp. W14]MBP2132216.1 DHA1 family bicyclomycin/chloramphenicol resistance-like MFS transporter [Methanomicrobium sp. W14]